MKVKERRWASILSAILFLVFSIWVVFIRKWFFTLACGTLNFIYEIIPASLDYWYQELRGTLWDFLYDILNSQWLAELILPDFYILIVQCILAVVSIFVLAIVIALFIGKRNLFPLVATIFLATASIINFGLYVIDEIRYSWFGIGEIIDGDILLGIQSLSGALLIAIFNVLIIVFAMIVLLNTFKTLRKKTAWTRFIGFIPGTLMILNSCASIIVYIATQIFDGYYIFNLDYIWSMFKWSFSEITFGLAILLMGIWITSGARGKIEKVEESATPEPEEAVENETVEKVEEPEAVEETDTAEENDEVEEPAPIVITAPIIIEEKPIESNKEKDAFDDNDPIEVMKRYKQLLDAGVITKEQFDEKIHKFLTR